MAKSRNSALFHGQFWQNGQFWQCPFLGVKSGGFHPNGMLGFTLYPKEAWWTLSGLCTAPFVVHGGARGVVGYPVYGVWRGGSIPAWYPWYGSGSLVYHCFPCFNVIFWLFWHFTEFPTFLTFLTFWLRDISVWLRDISVWLRDISVWLRDISVWPL